MSIKLNYKLTDPEERKQLVEKILEETPHPTEKYLEILADYLVAPVEKKDRKILTANRLATVNKRETSFEGLAEQMEGGEDTIYPLITNDKNQIFMHKVQITEEDVETVPFLRQVREAIEMWEQRLKSASGRSAYLIKKTIIDLRKDQYILKKAYQQPTVTQRASHATHWVPLEYNEYITPEGEIQYSGVSLLDPKVCAATLQNYSRLKEAGEANFTSDTWYFMESFDDVSGRALAQYPYLERLVEYKIDGKQNAEIQDLLQTEFGIKNSSVYLSTLWRRKIPRLIANQAREDFVDWWYLTQEKGQYKKCSRCGQIKLAHTQYFSRNRTSKDGWYSICKKCRKMGGKNTNGS